MKDACFDLLLFLGNKGLMLGLIFGVLLLLRPLLVRILSPQQRAVVWTGGWIYGWWLRSRHASLFPVSFQDLVSPRNTSISGEVPAFLPGEYREEGGYHLALPGGSLVRIELYDWFLWVLVALYLTGMAVLLISFWRRGRAVKAMVDRSRCLERSDPLLRCDQDREIDANVWLCPGLYSSFVYRTPMTWGTVGTAQASYQIFLQEELSPERQKLVLLHELRHIKLNHCYWKGIATFTLTLFWWNPLVWLAFRLFCRDLELACDSSVMKRLDRDEQREYAHTLVELGVGRQIWDAPLSFGECDGALRVKAVARWKASRWWRAVLTWAAAVLILSFFSGGHYKLPPVQDMPLAWERETGSADNFARVLGAEMAEELYSDWDIEPEDPRVVDVREAWTALKEYPESAMWVLDGAGYWYYVEYTWWGMTAQWVGVYGVEDTPAPDLTDSTLIYRR